VRLSQKKKKKKNPAAAAAAAARCQCFTPVILATQEAEIRRITV
jgi:hypothetical protein